MPTSLPPVLPTNTRRVRVQGYIDPETAHILFTQFYPLWGAQQRIIASVLTKLAQYVNEHCNPNDPFAAREQQLARILDRVSFADSGDEPDTL